MTCIIGLAEGGKVWIGGDSASSDGSWIVRATAIEKVFQCPPFLLGCETSFRMMQILRYHLGDLPEQGESNTTAYMVKTFVERIRRIFKEHGFAKIEDSKEEGGQFFVGYNGWLYLIGSDFQVNSYRDGLDAIGSGANLALGAMKALDFLPPRERVERALEVAAYFSGGVMPPFTVLEG